MTTDRLPSGRWRIRVGAGKRPDGTYRTLSRTLPANTTKAELHRAELALRIEAGHTSPDADMMPLVDVANSYIDLGERKRAAKTTYEYRGLVRRWLQPHPLGAQPLSRIRTSDLERHYAVIGQQVGVVTVRRLHSVLTSTFKWSVSQDWIRSNPATSVMSLPSEGRSRVTATDPNAWLAAIDVADEIQPGLHALLLMLGLTGARRSEALALTWADVEITDDHVAVSIDKALSVIGGLHVKDTKTHNARVVYCSPQLAEPLLGIRRRQHATIADQVGLEFVDTGFIWSRHDCGLIPWRPDVAGKWISKTGVLAQQLRHMVPTQMLAAGVDVNTVSQIMGHASAKMTLDTYAEATHDAVKAAADVMGRFGKPTQ